MATRLLDLQPVSPSAKQAFLDGRSADHLPKALRACWERVVHRVDPHGCEHTDVVVHADVRRRRETLGRWMQQLPHALATVDHELARRHHLLVFADVDGVVLHRRCRGWIAELADTTQIIDGSIWDEGRKGTNAIGTGLVEQRPIAVHGEAHYASRYHAFTCYAAPVFDLRGELLGVLDATSVADRRESLGWLAVLAATQELERLVRSTMSAGTGLLPLPAVERLLARFPGPAALLGPRGNVRAASEQAQSTQHGLRDIRSCWRQIRQAVSAGSSELSLEGGGTLHLEPFTDADGQLLEVAVFWDGSAPRRSVAVTRPGATDSFAPFFSSDPTLVDLCARARSLAATELPLTLLSETGTGKELLAQAIHDASDRASGPFVPLNCGAIAPGLLESELFGYAPGAFTGAAPGGRAGWLAEADGGTLFLDEVADMPPRLQVALLRFLDSGTYHRVGEQRLRRADVRVVAATSRDLSSMVAAGEFRPDLYYRICAAVLKLPPLRERADLLEFAERLLDEVCTEAGVQRVELSPEAARAVVAFRWPGNVRQLRYALMHAVAMCGSEGEIGPRHLPEFIGETTPEGSSREDATRRALMKALRLEGWNIAAAARTLGVARSTVYRMMERLGVSKPSSP
ncbi:MAG: sigma-54-dependent Fis family transcriptional regulator [Myxococcales bacterium]|nr:sigma-54-dependent Fis family transcriptional regulator [Myxococcales bacterium]